MGTVHPDACVTSPMNSSAFAAVDQIPHFSIFDSLLLLYGFFTLTARGNREVYFFVLIALSNFNTVWIRQSDLLLRLTLYQ